MRVGAVQVRGGMITRKPWCLLPRIEPPRASTMKLTRNLRVTQTDRFRWFPHQAHVWAGSKFFFWADPVWMGLATGLTLSEVSVAGLLGIRESSSYSFGSGTGVC